jgi:hypothetical protein
MKPNPQPQQEESLFNAPELSQVTNVSTRTAEGQRGENKTVYTPRLELTQRFKPLTDAEKWTEARELAARERAQRIQEDTQAKLRRETEQASEKAKQDAIDAEAFRQSLFGENGKYRGMQVRYEKWKKEG